MSRYSKFEKMSLSLRDSALDPIAKRLLIAELRGTEQEEDLSVPPNCKGFGRIRHFRRSLVRDYFWPCDPLPMDPACKALKLASLDVMRAQVFQVAACNFRCWYCFVPDDLIQPKTKNAQWFTAGELIELYLSGPDPPKVIDLSGGQPDIIPEWALWMLAELQDRGIDGEIYLWSDDNLSTDFFWRFLTDPERERILNYANYGRVCCFKGYDSTSFSFNTRTDEALFLQQFDLLRRLLSFGIDVYAYTTFTTPSCCNIQDQMRTFLDNLQELDPNLPLRTVPLEIIPFTPVKGRLTNETELALKNQYIVVEHWQKELELRFSSDERTMNIADVPLRGRK